MCSFLLLFLIVYIGFDLLHHSNPYWHTEKEGPSAASGSPSGLVPSPHWSGEIGSFFSLPVEAQVGISSFQRPAFFKANFSADHGFYTLAITDRKLTPEIKAHIPRGALKVLGAERKAKARNRLKAKGSRPKARRPKDRLLP